MRGVGPRQSRAQPPGRPLGNAPPVENALSIEGVRSGERGTPHGPGAMKSRPVAPGVTRGRTPNTPNTPSRSDRSSQEARSVHRAPSNDASPLSALVHQSSASLSSSGTTSLSSVYRTSERSQSSRQLDMLAVLQAAPLVYAGRPIDLLDHKAERDAIIASAQRAGRKVQVVCDFCTTRRMGALLTDGCRMLHYSGHGFTDIDRNGIQRTRLAFENEEGGTHALEVDKLTALVKAGADPSGGRPPLDLAVISACHSVGGGQAFVDAGVPHVIAVRREAQLQDKAACVFAGALYHALFKGRTVAAAFEIGKQAVANQPGILRAGEESEKFCLMPLDADHHVSLCADFPEGEAVVNTKHKVLHNLPAFFPLQFLGRQTEWQQIVAAAVGQDKRLLTLVGGPGIGKTALTVAVAHYLLERSTFNGGVFFARAQGTRTAFEVGASIRAALSDANVASDGDGDRKDVESTLPAELRRIGACLLVLDHWEPREATNSFLQTLLQSAPELRLLLSCTEALSFPGVGQRQVLLNPMPADEAGRLLRSLSPRPITRAEVGCDDKQNLRNEMQKLLNHFGSRVAGLDQFSLLSPPCTPVGELQNRPPLRVQWVLPNFVVANALYQELSAFPSKLQLDSPPPTASGRACLFGFISLPKMLSSHRLLDLLHGNPKAISLAASLLLSHNRSPRSLDQVFELLENPAEAAKSTDLSDSCRTILEQFDAITNAQGSPSHSGGRGAPSMSGSIDASGVVEASGESTPTTPSSPAVEEAPWNGEALPPSLLLRPDEYKKMSKHPSIRSLGTGLFGSVYETELAGTKVALKRFHGNALSSTSFKREAVLLADIRHPNVVQLIKVGIKPVLCMVTELLVCSLHAMIHNDSGGALREKLLQREAVPQICMHIARGMNYLHSLDKIVLHRNLNSKNLLLDDGGKVKISDFGWSCCKVDLGKTFHVSWEWVAPEVLGGGQFSEKADIYSFAMVVWEVLTQSRPFDGMNPMQMGFAVGSQGYRPPIPSDAPKGLSDLIAACWHNEPQQRPSFASILGKLQALEVIGEL